LNWDFARITLLETFMRLHHLLTKTLFSAALLALPALAFAQDDTAAAKSTDKSADKYSDKSAEKMPPAEVTTQGTVEVTGQHIAYNAIAGTLTVGATDVQDAQLGMDGRPQPGSQLALAEPKDPKDATPFARIFYVAYFKGVPGDGSSSLGQKKDARAEDRPITFFYNGGPGSSTVWLHMGSLGPKHVVTDGDQHLPAAPYKLVDNAYSLLDTSDLVFIDMPGTGFGRLVGKDAGKAFWGVDEDANAFARFIARFITKYNRWNSPKYVFGESYGTTRSAVLANILANSKSIDLNGVILLSQIFNFTTDIDGPGGNPGVDLPYVLALPTYAATAWYHKKLPQQPPALEPFLKDVEDFTMGGYSHALALGTDITAEEKQSVAEKLHEYTGLPFGLPAQGKFARQRRRIRKDLAGRSGPDHRPPRYTLFRTQFEPVERERRVRSAELGHFLCLRSSLQRLRSPRSEVRRRANLPARSAVRWCALGFRASRQPDQPERSQRSGRGAQDESASPHYGQRRLLRSGYAVLRRTVRGETPAHPAIARQEHRIRLVRIWAHGLCPR
jgi:carboxypeptidase C (cathepsin A)